MNLARVIGTATATVKHASLQGWRMLIVQPLAADGSSDGEPLLAVDGLGAEVGGRVILSSDGSAVSDLLGTKQTPARWMVQALPDDG